MPSYEVDKCVNCGYPKEAHAEGWHADDCALGLGAVNGCDCCAQSVCKAFDPVNESMQERVRFKCPDCQADCVAGYTVAGNHPCIVHPLPQCPGFMRDEPLDEFLKRARITGMN